VFFKGKRVGQHGKVFYILKFRSMVPDAPQKGPAITCRDDPRVTRIGRILRKTKLDELPSLVNVLLGEMSLVGPRPESPTWVECYTPRQRAVLNVKPGITGPSQIKYRDEEELLIGANLETAYTRIMNDKLNIDLDYVEHRSLILDMRILLETAVALFGGPSLVGQYVRRIAFDLVSIPFAFYLAWLVRFDGRIPATEWKTLTRYMIPITCVYVMVNAVSGIYRRLWAYASFRDVFLLSETIALGTSILVAVNVYVLQYRYRSGVSTGGLVIGGSLALVLSVAIKYRSQLKATALCAFWPRLTDSDVKRVLIAGINPTAQQLATQIYLGNCQANYELVGFVDDDPNGYGMNLNGVEILGRPEQIPRLVRDRQVDVVVIAHRPFEGEKVWQLVSACRETTAQVKILPGLIDLIEGYYQDPLVLRDVSIEDILDRAPVTVSVEVCRRVLADKVVLVTGAAGSIGSELCRQILRCDPRLLLALDHDESGLHELNLEINPDGQMPLQLIVADIVDWQKMNKVFEQYRPQAVFHAAAYKHVPLLEHHADEALRVNVMGTVIASEMAHEYEAERFVFISTDKAVNPSSVMGASKRIGEMWMRAMAGRSDTLFNAVRFGNVIGSRGSALLTFARQIESGGPVTVTDPEMHRFFISIPEAVSLVLQAAAFKQGEEIYMLEMGEQVSILDLAQRMIRLKGLRVHKDIEIEFVGVRPGEKLREELAYECELKKRTPHPRIYGLQRRDESIDHDILLGAILILMRSLRLSGGDPQYVREGIFQIASYDIDGFLDKVTRLDLAPGRRQLAGKSSDDKREPVFDVATHRRTAQLSAGD